MASLGKGGGRVADVGEALAGPLGHPRLLLPPFRAVRYVGEPAGAAGNPGTPPRWFRRSPFGNVQVEGAARLKATADGKPGNSFPCAVPVCGCGLRPEPFLPSVGDIRGEVERADAGVVLLKV